MGLKETGFKNVNWIYRTENRVKRQTVANKVLLDSIKVGEFLDELNCW
jgi:hypothetical protein